MRARSHDIVAIDACPLFAPSMAGAIPAARALAGGLRGSASRSTSASPRQATASTSTCAARGRSGSPRRASSPDRRDARPRPRLKPRRRRGRAPPAARRLRRYARHASARRLPSGDRGGRSAARGGRGRALKGAKRSPTSSAAPAPSPSVSPARTTSPPSTRTRPRSHALQRAAGERMASTRSRRMRAISSTARSRQASLPHSTACCSIRRAQAPKPKRGKSRRAAFRSLSPSPATPQLSPATRAS